MFNNKCGGGCDMFMLLMLLCCCGKNDGCNHDCGCDRKCDCRHDCGCGGGFGGFGGGQDCCDILLWIMLLNCMCGSNKGNCCR